MMFRKKAEERIHELKDKSINIVYTEEEKDKERERNEQSLRDLWNTIKHSCKACGFPNLATPGRGASCSRPLERRSSEMGWEQKPRNASMLPGW